MKNTGKKIAVIGIHAVWKIAMMIAWITYVLCVFVALFTIGAKTMDPVHYDLVKNWILFCRIWIFAWPILRFCIIRRIAEYFCIE